MSADHLLHNAILDALAVEMELTADELSTYLNTPLGAVRVALAHLFFKTNQVTCVPQVKGQKRAVAYTLGDPTRLIEMKE